MVELLFWPALLAYGEAAAAYFGEARRPGRLGNAATWGVRIGWLLQTALLVVQAVSADGFPWGSWAGSLNLFVWLVVGIYLVWGCNSRFRLLGLAVLPLAAALFALAYVAGGTSTGPASTLPSLFLVLHVGLVLAAFAGFTLAAALAGLYLWEERRLKLRAPDILRLRLPPLQSLERLTQRAIVVSLPLLTLGLAAGIVRLRQQGGSTDPLEWLTIATWLLYGGFLVARPSGRRAAYLAIGGFALVVVSRLALAGGHFA